MVICVAMRQEKRKAVIDSILVLTSAAAISKATAGNIASALYAFIPLLQKMPCRVCVFSALIT